MSAGSCSEQSWLYAMSLGFLLGALMGGTAAALLFIRWLLSERDALDADPFEDEKGSRAD